MKRRVIQLVLLLLAGAFVNVAVAWGCERWSPVGSLQGETRTGFGIAREYEVSSMHVNHADTLTGWPMRCLRFNYWASFARWHDGLSDDLPVELLWHGFAINTIFYAAVLWLVFAFPFVMRQRRRIKRGLCPACAYPIGTSPVCTECGAALKPQATLDQ